MVWILQSKSLQTLNNSLLAPSVIPRFFTTSPGPKRTKLPLLASLSGLPPLGCPNWGAGDLALPLDGALAGMINGPALDWVAGAGAGVGTGVGAGVGAGAGAGA
eukprot:5777942-Karenia_brevis.AAC.1